jgi:hypothetical protein
MQQKHARPITELAVESLSAITGGYPASTSNGTGLGAGMPATANRAAPVDPSSEMQRTGWWYKNTKTGDFTPSRTLEDVIAQRDHGSTPPLKLK